MTKDELINFLIKDGYLKTSLVIEAFKTIDREDFVSEDLKAQAYDNVPLPIGDGQTISQPLVVAFMLELLDLRLGDKVLEIGSGSGWKTALMAKIVGNIGKIYALERIPQLYELSKANTSKYSFPTDLAESNLGRGVIELICVDASKGYEDQAPYDKIIAAAAAEKIPEEWKTQLKIGGRIVAPVGNSILVLEKISKDKFEQKEYFGFSFVPLISD